MNIEYSIIPHFKVRLFPKNYNDNVLFEFPPPNKDESIEGGLGKLERKKSKGNGKCWTKANMHNANSFPLDLV